MARGDRADIVVIVTESGLGTRIWHAARITAGAEARPGGAVSRDLSVSSPATRRRDRLEEGSQSTTAGGRDRVAVVAFVQEKRGRAILAAASAALRE